MESLTVFLAILLVLSLLVSTAICAIGIKMHMEIKGVSDAKLERMESALQEVVSIRDILEDVELRLNAQKSTLDDKFEQLRMVVELNKPQTRF